MLSPVPPLVLSFTVKQRGDTSKMLYVGALNGIFPPINCSSGLPVA